MDDLRKVMAVLRTPEIGCPWDTEQTYASIAPYTIEEAYEVADAIQRNDFYDLKDELGDHLFQVIFYSQIASEDERFTLDDVIDGATRKMVRRHPHVFGDAETRARGASPDMWDGIKAEEAATKRATLGEDAAPPPEKLASRLDNVPLALPALSRAEKLTKRAAKVGFDWPDARPILDKLKEEIAEFEAELAAGHADNMEDEYGDMLFVLVNLARFLKIDPEHALRRTNAKFERRFRHIEKGLHEQGREISQVTLEDMEALWDEAKSIEKAAKASSGG
ncbi:MAG: nucleoside triphosphate pyrophosphohydrolase [Alphaproteobacteria bacterium]